jgi:hypothetical protein
MSPGAGVTAQRLAQVREQHRGGTATVEVALQVVVFAYRLACLVSGAGRSERRPDGVPGEAPREAPGDIVTLGLLAEDFGWRSEDEHLADYREFLAALVTALQAVTPADRAVLAVLVQRGKTLRLGLGSPTYGMSGAELGGMVRLPRPDLEARVAALEEEGLVVWQRHRQPAQEWVWTGKRDAYALDGLRSFCTGRGLDLGVLLRDVRLDWLG